VKLKIPKPISDTSRAPNFLMRMLQTPISYRTGSAVLAIDDVL